MTDPDYTGAFAMMNLYRAVGLASAISICSFFSFARALADELLNAHKISLAAIDAVLVTDSDNCNSFRDEIKKAAPEAKVLIGEYQPVSAWASIRLGATAFVDPQKVAEVKFVSGKSPQDAERLASDTSGAKISGSNNNQIDWEKIYGDKNVLGIGTAVGKDTLCVIDKKYIEMPANPSALSAVNWKSGANAIKVVTKYDDQSLIGTKGYYSVNNK